VSYPVRYHCPRCETVVTLSREGYLDDRAVTPYPFEGWDYVTPDEPFDGADGVRFECGRSGGADWDGDGCGDPFYLSFVRHEGGEPVEPRRPAESVEIAADRGPSGPRGPSTPFR
jgi:hypothetical protein